MINGVSRLPRNHPTKQKFVKFISDRSCAKGRVTNKVYCCDGRKGTFPTDCKLKQIKNPRPKTRPNPRPASNTGGNSPAGNRKVIKRYSLNFLHAVLRLFSSLKCPDFKKC